MAFADLFVQLAHENDSIFQRLREAQAALDAELLADWRAAHPRSRAREPDLQTAPNAAAITARWMAKGEELHAAHKLRAAALEKLLTEAAAAEPLPTTDVLIQVDLTPTSTYRSQGYGAATYAKRAAQFRADNAQHHGLRAEVRAIENDPNQADGFAVFANTTPVGWEMVRRRPGQTLREWLKACWASGTNPRVFNPYLDPDLEDRLGIDYFGNDIPPIADRTRLPLETVS